MAMNGVARLVLSEATKKGTRSAFKEYADKVTGNANEEAAKILKSNKKK